MTEPLLDRAALHELLRRLGERLLRRGVVGDLYVIGGAAMALAYDARRATRDIGAVFVPHGIVHEEALALAAELGLPRWWLAMKALAARRRDTDDLRLLVDRLGLRSSAEVVAVCARVFPDEPLRGRALLAVQDLFGEAPAEP